MILLFCLLITASMQDMIAGRVTNRLIAAGLIIGLAFRVTERGVCGIYYFLGSISVPVILLYLLFQMRALGAGDIKLFSMTGGILTIGELFRCMAYAFLAAGFLSALCLAFDRDRRIKLWHAARYLAFVLRTGRIEPYCAPQKTGQRSFAFAVCILFGAYAALYFPVFG